MIMISAWSRRRFWSDSWLAKKILPLPYSSNIKPQFDEYMNFINRQELEDNLKKQYPIRYAIRETYLDLAQDIVMFPIDLALWIRRYLSNRFFHKYHMLRTGLKKGEYYDLDERILRACFTGLEEFVEVECAWMEHILNSDKYDGRRITFRRDATKGIDYLITQGGINHELVAERNKEILALYNWWKIERPARVDPYEDETHAKEAYEIETKYEEEDQEMLIRLMKVRGSLWT